MQTWLPCTTSVTTFALEAQARAHLMQTCGLRAVSTGVPPRRRLSPRTCASTNPSSGSPRVRNLVTGLSHAALCQVEGVAIFHLSAKLISRKQGRSSTAAAAYRAADVIRDNRTGQVFDYSKRAGVVCSELMLPHGLKRDRAEFWNTVEAKNRRADARVAREIVIALPAELSSSERLELARGFAELIIERFKIAVDLCIHLPSKGGDDRNHHAHLLTSTNVIEPNGVLGNKVRQLDAVARTMAGDRANAIQELRAQWEVLANAALERSGRSERIDRRSHLARGLQAEPTRHMGVAVTKLERDAKDRASRSGTSYTAVTGRYSEQIALSSRNVIRMEAFRARLLRAKPSFEKLAMLAGRTVGSIRKFLHRVVERPGRQTDVEIIQSIKERLCRQGRIPDPAVAASYDAGMHRLIALRRDRRAFSGVPLEDDALGVISRLDQEIESLKQRLSGLDDQIKAGEALIRSEFFRARGRAYLGGLTLLATALKIERERE